MVMRHISSGVATMGWFRRSVCRSGPLACLLFLVVNTGCMVAMNMPQLRYTSPQVRGAAWHGHALVSAQHTTRVVLVPSTLVTPPVTDRPGFDDEGGSAGIAGGLGVSKRLELYVRGFSDSPLFIGGKYQLAGSPASSPDRKDLCVAVLLGGGGARSSGTDTNSGSGVHTRRELHSYAAEAGLLAGERVGALLPYGGIYYSRYWANGTVRQDFATYPFDGRGDQWSVNAGLACRRGHVEAWSELARTISTWESVSDTETAFGLGLGVGW